jgi:hypothetical protein
VPILEENLHWVRGDCCQRLLISRIAPEALAELDPDAIESKRLIYDRVSPIKIALLVGAFTLSCVPIIGSMFLLLAWLPSGSSQPWFRIACRLCLLLHVIALNLLVVAFFASDKR